MGRRRQSRAREAGALMTAERAFRALLRLYPASFRRRFEAEMVELFLSRARAATAGRRQMRFWVRTLSDVALSLGREYRRAVAARPRSVWTNAAADLRSASRFLRRAPAVTTAVIGLMAIGIGAATTVFGLVNVVLLRPLPYRDADRIVSIWETRPDRGVKRNVVAGHEFPDWQRRTSSFDSLAAYVFEGSGTALTGVGEPVALFNVRVTSAFFDVMDAGFTLGRGFAPEHDVPGQGGVAVISHRLWRERFGGASDMIGRVIQIGGVSATVIGVAPASFQFPTGPNGQGPDVWRPIAEPIHLYRGRHYLFVIGRLKPEVTLARAQEDLDRAAAAIATELPDFSRGHGASLAPLREELVRTSRPTLVFVFAGVTCLVLIGCANVAGLLMAVAIGRKAELRVRMALGASRSRVIRQLVAEGLTLAIAGGGAGVVLAIWLSWLAPAVVPAEILTLDRVPIDWRVLAFVIVLSTGTGVAFGLAPALHLPIGSLSESLRDPGRSAEAAQPRLRRALVVAQIALTVTLVTSAGLMLRTWRSLSDVELGFAPDGLVAVDLALPAARYAEPHRVRQFYETLDARLRALPGVREISMTNLLPVAGGVSTVPIAVEGRPAPRPGDETTATYRVVGVDYFSTIGIPVRAGRVFAPSDARASLPLIRWHPQQPSPVGFDRPQAAPVAVVNQAMAQQVWPGEDPIGRQFRVLFSPAVTVVGVVANSRGRSLREPHRPEFYLSDLQEPQARTNVIVRASVPAEAIIPLVRREVRAIDPDLPLLSADAMTGVIDAGVQLSRFTSISIAVFAGTGLALMMAGLYGLLSFTTAVRTREIGVRLALGAGAAEIRRLILSQSVALGGAGLLLGVAMAWPTARLLEAQLFGVEPHDPMNFVWTAAVLAMALLAATYGPARRAARIDPAVALRH